MHRIALALAFAAGVLFASYFSIPGAIAEDGPTERPACDSCSGTGSVKCLTCKGLGKLVEKAGAKPVSCRVCAGKGKTTCYRCRGSGKRIILQDVISKERRAACGITKLSVSEQEALAVEVFRIYHDPWGDAASEYLESEGWSKFTVTRVLKNGLLVTGESGQELQLEDSLPLLSVDAGDHLWLESEYGLTDVIGPDGSTGSYSVE